MLRWLALLSIPLAAAAEGRWIHIRSGPFEIVTDAGDRGGRETLNQLEQVRYLLGTALGNQDLKTLWPVRIVIAKAVAAAPPVWVRDTYSGAVPPDSALPPECLREVVRILIESNTGRMPAGTGGFLLDGAGGRDQGHNWRSPAPGSAQCGLGADRPARNGPELLRKAARAALQSAARRRPHAGHAKRFRQIGGRDR